MFSELTVADIFIIIFVIVAIVVAALYFLNRWAANKMSDQQDMIERTKQQATIYVIDKKKMKAAEANLPKAVQSQLPRMYKFIKMHFVKAKVGPQILTLMCDKNVFEKLQVKKNVKVVLAGIYIAEIKGGSKSEPEPKKAGFFDAFKRKKG